MATNKKQKLPPPWADRLLEWFIAPHLLEDVQGDLYEIYHKRINQVGTAQAKREYILAVFRYITPFFYTRKPSEYPNPVITDMLQNYVKIAFRNLLKSKSFSFINILGLALGMICCLFIFLWVQDEKSIDNFHANGKNLYTAYQTITANGKVEGNYTTPIRSGNGQRSPEFILEDAKEAIPEVQSVVFYATGYELPWGHPETFQVGTKKIKLEGSRASKDFFKVFSYPLIAGNVETALKDVRGIAISRKMAELFFENPRTAIGKTIRYENRLDLMITAVFENLPSESSLKFDFLLSWEAQKKNLEWASNDFRTYIQLAEGAGVNTVETKINRLLQPQLSNDKGVTTHIGLQPFHEQYLHGTFVEGKPEGGRIEYVRIFSGVAIFILLIACINFMNLATARSVKRAKEVGVRKVLGSTRAHLIGQFFSEALLLSFLAMGLTLLLTLGLLPVFNSFTGKQINSPFTQLSFWTSLIGLMLLTGLLAGSYPAFFLSSLQPVRILKGVVRVTQSAIWFRKGLTVFQFGLSILLLVATIVISKQTNYVQTSHVGYERENLLYLRVEGELMQQNKYSLFKEQVSNMPGIAMVDRSSEAPHMMGFVVDATDGIAETNTGDDAINWEGKEKNTSVGFKPTSVGFDFIQLMNLTLVEGRNFSRANATDSSDAFLVNEEAVRQMGMKDPIGKWVSAWQKKGHIIGVLKDYHTHSLHEPIKPLIVDVKEYESFGVILVRTQAGKTKEALASLEEVYKKVNPNYPFAYQFIDQEYERLYRSEQLMAKLANVFAALAIVISCLGLLGLVMFSAEQRTKEIGIRKVLGASVAGIVALLSRDFLKLILLSIVIASPIAWITMNRWLQDFAYKIDIEWWIFALAGLSAIGIALATVSFQSIKAALMNPVKSLRTE